MALPRFGPHVSLARVTPLLGEMEQAVRELEQRRERLQPGMPAEELGGIIRIYEGYVHSATIVGSLVGVLSDLESGDEKVRAARSFVQRQETALAERILFFTLTLKQWSKEELARHAESLPRYRMWLLRIAQYAPHTLSEKEERIILHKDNTGESLLKHIYTMVTADYEYSMVVDGKRTSLTYSELAQYFVHPDRAVRKAASESLQKRYAQDNKLLGEIYKGIAEDYDTEVLQLRGYSRPIEARHQGNNIPHAAYEALAAVTKRNQVLFQEYIELKRKALGYEDFTRFDFSAPVDGAPERITYDEAKARVLAAFKDFAPWMHSGAKRIFDGQCVDAEPRKGKAGGAACYALAPGETPLLFLNFNGTYDNLFTLAHELGHAVHDVLTAEHSALTFHPPLVLAEAASTFAETLVLLRELENASKQQRIALLCRYLDDALGTISSQMRVTHFELQAHDLLVAGGSPEQLNRLWAQLAKEYYPAVDFPEESVQWTAIPHIYHSPFYCYSYSFGLLLVLSLLRKYEEEGEVFVEKYRSLLTAGGTVPPVELLASLGYDITSESFWGGGFSVLRERVSELRELLDG